MTGELAVAVDNFPPDGVVATDEIIGGIFLTGNELLWVEKLTARALRTSTTTKTLTPTHIHTHTQTYSNTHTHSHRHTH